MTDPPEKNPVRLLDEIVAAYRDPAGSRIITLMGPNASGKSRLLRSIPQQLDSLDIPNIYLPPNRQPTTSHQTGPVPANAAQIVSALARPKKAVRNMPFEGEV